MRTISILLLAACAAFAQYKMAPAGAPPAAIAGSLESAGYQILNAAGQTFCTVWVAKALPPGPASKEENVTLPAIPHGALLGAIEFPTPGADRRGQSLKSGLYTMRFSINPQDGNHMGVAPQRDFAILVPAAEDKDLAALPSYAQLMPMSAKASGTSHPAILEMWASQEQQLPSFAKSGEKDWVLHVKIGGATVAIVLVGKAES